MATGAAQDQGEPIGRRRRASKTATTTAITCAMQVFLASPILASKASCLVGACSMPSSRAVRTRDWIWLHHSRSLKPSAIAETSMACEMHTQYGTRKSCSFAAYCSSFEAARNVVNTSVSPALTRSAAPLLFLKHALAWPTCPQLEGARTYDVPDLGSRREDHLELAV